MIGKNEWGKYYYLFGILVVDTRMSEKCRCIENEERNRYVLKGK
jgi:hypothetical protein